jgi:hypothetical protein
MRASANSPIWKRWSGKAVSIVVWSRNRTSNSLCPMVSCAFRQMGQEKDYILFAGTAADC